MGCHQSLLWYARSSGYILALPGLTRIYCDIQQGASRLYPPTWGVHESKPFKSNSWNRLPHLCLIVNFRVWESGHTLSWTGSSPGLGGSGNGCTATALATGVFFWRVWGRWCCSALSQLPSYCPFSVQYTYSVW